MAGRCSCASPPSTGAALSTPANGCMTVSGAGTPSSPFLIGLAPNCFAVQSCTSTTRPVTPSPGQMIWETDTERLRVWDDKVSAWRLLSGKQPTLQQFYGDGLSGQTQGVVTTLTATIDNVFAAGDQCYYLLSGTCVMSGLAGDTWDLLLESNGSIVDVDRVSIGGDGWGTGKVWSVNGVTTESTILMQIQWVAGSGQYHTYSSPSYLHQLKALPLLLA